MRILWVDDESKKLKQEGGTGKWFGQLDFVEIDRFSTALNEISDSLEKYDLILLDINLDGRPENPEPDSGIVSRAISAINGSTKNEYDEKEYGEFLQSAGFYLYHKIIEKGFPKERIRFLTGYFEGDDFNSRKQKFKSIFYDRNSTRIQKDEAAKGLFVSLNEEQRKEFIAALQKEKDLDKFLENLDIKKKDDKYVGTYESYLNYSRIAKLELPGAFDKSKPEGCKQWLNQFFTRDDKNKDSHSDLDYLELRRGILDTCDGIVDGIKNKKINITSPFNDKNADDQGYADGPLNLETFVQELRALVQSHSVPNSQNLPRLYFTLASVFTRPFERFTGRSGDQYKIFNGGYIQEKKQGDNRKKIHAGYAIPATLVRNWIAHGLMSNNCSDLSAPDVAFLFVSAIYCICGFACQKNFPSMFYENINEGKVLSKVYDILKTLYENPYGQSNKWHPDRPLYMIKRRGMKEYSGWEKRNFVEHMYWSLLLSSVEQEDAYVMRDQECNCGDFFSLHGPYLLVTYEMVKESSKTPFRDLIGMAYRSLANIEGKKTNP